MKHRFKVPIHVALEEALSSVGDIIHSVNDIMADFGLLEKLTVRSPLFFMEVTVDKEPTHAELVKIREVIEEQFQEKLAKYKPTVAPVSEWTHERILA
jgi:hypothetical protein